MIWLLPFAAAIIHVVLGFVTSDTTEAIVMWCLAVAFGTMAVYFYRIGKVYR